MQGKISSVVCSAFCYSTEREERIEAALRNIHPDIDITWKRVDTHFGNSMKIATGMLKRPEHFTEMVSKMDMRVLEELAATVQERIDEWSTFHIRFDKQSLLAGEMKLSSSLPERERKERDSVELQLKVITYPGGQERAAEFVLHLLTNGAGVAQTGQRRKA